VALQRTNQFRPPINQNSTRPFVKPRRNGPPNIYRCICKVNPPPTTPHLKPPAAVVVHVLDEESAYKYNSPCYHDQFQNFQQIQDTKANPVRAWTAPVGSRRLRLPEFLDNRHMTVARLSALCNGRLYPQEISLVFTRVTG
jgi:hypothetical protein